MCVVFKLPKDRATMVELEYEKKYSFAKQHKNVAVCHGGIVG